MSNKLKTAICLSGFTRKYKICLIHLRKFLLKNLDLDIDFFIHTWDIMDRNGPKIDPFTIYRKYNPKLILIEPPINFPISNEMLEKNMQNRDLNGIMSEFYSMEEANKLKIKYEQEYNFIYDAVFRFRFDIKLNDQIFLNKLTNLSKLYIPKWGDYAGINTQFAYSNSSNMDKYCSVFTNMDNILSREPVVNPECFIKTIIEDNNLEIIRPNIDYILYHRKRNNYYWEKLMGFI